MITSDNVVKWVSMVGWRKSPITMLLATVMVEFTIIGKQITTLIVSYSELEEQEPTDRNDTSTIRAGRDI